MANDTRLMYNGIWLQNVLTDDISQEVVMDSTGVNPIYVRVSVSVTCLVHTQAPSYSTNKHGIALPEYSPSPLLGDGYNDIVGRLMQPARDFQMWIGNSLFMDIHPGWRRQGLPPPSQAFNAKMDVNHGPIPSVQILQTVSAATFRIRFRVVCHLPFVDIDNVYANNAISFRFWIADDINGHDWTTERTYSGVLRVRHLQLGIHQIFRANFWVPPLMGGFQRKRITMHERSNGLELDFTIVDQELYAAAPYPACDWEGSQTIYTTASFGTMFNSEVSVKVWGDKTVPKRGLLQLCQKIMDAKLHRLDMAKDKQTFLLGLRFRDDFKHNWIESQATIKLIDKQGTTLWSVPFGSFARDVGAGTYGIKDYNREKTYAPGPTASLKGLLLSTLQDPEHVYSWPKYDTSLEPIQEEQDPYPPPGSPTDPVIPTETTLLSPAHTDVSGYNVYRLTSENHINHGTIQLPFGKSSSGSKDTCRVLQVHQATGRRAVLLEAERIENWPTLPPPEVFTDETTGIVHTPLKTWITPSAPILSWDGKKTLYHVDAKYIFAQDRNPNPKDGEIAAGLLPWRMQGSANVYVVPAIAFGTDSKTILNAT